VSETDPLRDPAPAASLPTRLAVGALRRLPVHALSRLAGRLAAWRLPGPLQRAEIRLFGGLVGVDWDEVRDPIEQFQTLQQFFTRALEPGVRPIDPAPDALVSPCDGSWGAAGRVESGMLLQLKGRPYSLADLLGDTAEARAYEGGAFATFYLSPRDYHRFHMPCDATPLRARYLPGHLFPVNAIGLHGVEGLFAENERIVATFVAPGGTSLCLVAVGATMVGKVHVDFDDLTTQAGGRREERVYPDARRYAKGEEWGRFEFGSTLVLVAKPGALRVDAEEPGSPLRLGARIGSIGAAG
jgi:phosphatidylserine decarboxylase